MISRSCFILHKTTTRPKWKVLHGLPCGIERDNAFGKNAKWCNRIYISMYIIKFECIINCEKKNVTQSFENFQIKM